MSWSVLSGRSVQIHITALDEFLLWVVSSFWLPSRLIHDGMKGAVPDDALELFVFQFVPAEYVVLTPDIEIV